MAGAAAVARRGARDRGVGDGPAARRAGRPPARGGPPRRRPARPAQPVRGGVHRPHVGHAARLRGAAVAAAVRPPRAAGAALVVVAGGLRAGHRVHGRRRQRGRDGVGAARPAPAGDLRALRRRRAEQGAGRVRLARRAADGAGGRLVGGPDARAGAPRRRLPALHRAAGHDLVDHQPAGVAAADGLLDLLPRRRLRREAAAAVLGRRRAAVRVAGRGGRPARAGAGAHRVPARPARPLRPVLPAARAGRPAGDGGRLPRGDAAAAGDELHLQPRRAAPVPAHDLQGGAAGRARARVPGRPRGGAGRAVAARPRRAGRRAPRWPAWRCWPRSRAGRSSAGRRSTRS